MLLVPFQIPVNSTQLILKKCCRLEHGVYNLSRMRESAAERYKGFHIPVNWMLDTGYVTQVQSHPHRSWLLLIYI